MKRDRFLLGILLGIGALVLLALALFFLRASQVSDIDESTPEGVLQNYLLALQKSDYERAYRYLADVPGKPDLLTFRTPFVTFQQSDISNTAVEIGETLTDEAAQTANVTVTMIRGGRGLFEDVYREQQVARLIRQDAAWKIINAPYPYWSYDWPTALPAEDKPAPSP